jgi:hypothetical protein
MSTATAEAMARLLDQRDRASVRLDELEGEARAAGQAAAEASAALAEFERQGGKAAERRQLEQELAAAKQRAQEPWHERAEGARAALRDADEELRQYQAQHLTELVEALEADGRIVASKIDDAAEALVTAYSERERIAHEISAIASQAGRIHFGDISFIRSEALAREARTLIHEGGEVPPTLRHDPRQPRLGEPAAADEKVEAA